MPFVDYLDYFAAWAQIMEAAEEDEARLIIKPKERKRCGGCGQFMPKDMGLETYVSMAGIPHHMTEKCLLKGVENLKKSHSKFQWDRETDDEAPWDRI